MSKIVGYRVVAEGIQSVNSFNSQCKYLVGEGWTPYGELKLIQSNHKDWSPYLVQAFVKYQDSEQTD